MLRQLFSSIVCFIFALCLLWISNIAYAQETETIKVGYVNIRKIMVQAPQLEQIQQKLSAEFDAQRQKIISLRNEIATLSNAYDESAADNAATSPEQLERLQQNIDDKQLMLTNLQQRMQDAFNLRRNESLAKLQTLIINSVAKVSKEKGLDIVLNNTGVVYVNKRVDITTDVFNYLAEQRID